MLELEKQWKKGNRTFTQIYSDGKWYIYEVFAVYDEKRNITHTYYEVFKKKVAPHKIYDNGWKTTGEMCERYPSNEDFGVWAWCCNTVKRCHHIMKVKDTPNSLGE